MIATFAIGNSDDKLSQHDWSTFVGETYEAVDQAALAGARIHFAGYSAPGAPWQNAMWAVELPDANPAVRQHLRAVLRGLAERFGQDSVAWWESPDVEMLEPAG